MNNKKVFFTATKSASGYKTKGHNNWSAEYEVLRYGCTESENDSDIFSSWNWNGKQLVVKTCLTGVIPLYCYCDSKQIIISPSIEIVVSIANDTELDDDAISVFLRIGFFIGNTTPFKNIKVVGPHALFVWPYENIPPSAYPSFTETTWTFKQAKSAYLELFHNSISRRLPPTKKFKMPLTAGRDSRHILSELMDFGKKPAVCYTAEIYPPWISGDVLIAKNLSKHLGIKHISIPYLKSKVDAEMRKNKLTDYCADEHTWGVSILDLLGDKPTTIYDGINAGVLFGRIGDNESLKLYMQKEPTKLADLLFSRYKVPEIWFSYALKEEFQLKWNLNRAKRMLCNELKHFYDCPNPLQAFYFWNRVRRETSLYTFGMFSDHNVICPFLDSDLVSFALSLPAEISSRYDFQESALKDKFNVDFSTKIESKRNKMVSVSHNYTRKYAVDLILNFIKSRSSKVVNANMMLRQLVKTVLNGRHSGLDWISPEVSLYLLQLENMKKTPNL